MDEYRLAAANCDLRHKGIISLKPFDGLGKQTLSFASKSNSLASVTALFLITRRGAVVHGVGFFLNDPLRAESLDSDHSFERIVRAADRRVRRGIQQAQP